MADMFENRFLHLTLEKKSGEEISFDLRAQVQEFFDRLPPTDGKISVELQFVHRPFQM